MYSNKTTLNSQLCRWTTPADAVLQDMTVPMLKKVCEAVGGAAVPSLQRTVQGSAAGTGLGFKHAARERPEGP